MDRTSRAARMLALPGCQVVAGNRSIEAAISHEMRSRYVRVARLTVPASVSSIPASTVRAMTENVVSVIASSMLVAN